MGYIGLKVLQALWKNQERPAEEVQVEEKPAVEPPAEEKPTEEAKAEEQPTPADQADAEKEKPADESPAEGKPAAKLKIQEPEKLSLTVVDLRGERVLSKAEVEEALGKRLEAQLFANGCELQADVSLKTSGLED